MWEITELESIELISVIIPVYNVEQYLDRCMKSVLNQTYKELEIILVDDGSTDRSGIICDEYASKDSRVRVIHKRNEGLSAARNEGLNIARGKYIGFVDSDDWIAADMYFTLYKLIKNGNYDISVCGIVRTDEFENLEFDQNASVEKITEYTSTDFQKKILKVSTQDSNHYAVNKLYFRNVFQHARYPQGLIDEDVEGTFLAVLDSKYIIETSKVGYFYWVNSQSITTARFSKKQFDYLTICDRVHKIAQERCSEEIKGYAQLFRYRADFGILCKMSMLPKKDTAEFKTEKTELLSNLKKHYIKLMRASIPISRKILISCFCVNYEFSSTMMRLCADIFRKRISLRH